MKGYIIKVTILSGRREGHTYYMKKGGYVTNEEVPKFDCDVYKTLGAAKSVCKRFYNTNELNHNAEKKEKEYKKSKGMQVDNWFIYDREFYEPVEVEYYKNLWSMDK